MTDLKSIFPYKIVTESLKKLKPNEKRVICGRFGIDQNRQTLSAIGKELNLSRERIRQVEKEALKHLAKSIAEKEKGSIDALILAFEKSGGITSHDKIVEKYLNQTFRGDLNQFNALNLIFTIIPQIKKIEKTKELEASWILSTLTKEELLVVINDWVNHLEKTKKPLSIDVLVDANPAHKKYQITFLSELPSVSKKLIKTDSGYIGLSKWPEVNPKNVRDKIYFILKKEKTPMHFSLIAQKINEYGFSKKKVVQATVHNELIADHRFVLIGRGIYGLSEWGYKPGTVQDIITEVLSGYTKMTVDEIVSAVSKQRTVKKNTILINLQTKPEFKKVGKDCYALKKNIKKKSVK